MSQKTIKKRREFTQAFKERAVARMDKCASVVGLAEELGICWSLLYKWRDRLQQQAASQNDREQERAAAAAEKELAELRAALATKSLEVDFFKGALQKIEARRQKLGGVAFTTKSGK